MADRCARAAVVRARAAARSAVGGARARGSRRRGAPARSAPGRSHDASRACCSCRRRCAIRKVLRTLLLLDLESHPPAAAIDIVTIELDPAPARIIQYSLLERACRRRKRSRRSPRASARSSATARCGSPCCSIPIGRMHSKCARSRRIASSAHRVGLPPEGGATRLPAEPRVHRPRSGRERIASRGAGESPRQSPSRRVCAASGRRSPSAWRSSAGGRCVSAIDRRGMPGGDVAQRAGPWRYVGRMVGCGDGAWDRDEWDVALGDGSVCRLFHDRHRPSRGSSTASSIDGPISRPCTSSCTPPPRFPFSTARRCPKR